MNTLTIRVKCGLTWLRILMFEMFISQMPGSHLKKPRCGLPDLGWSAKNSRCCASLLWCTFSGWPLWSLWGVHYKWWFPWGICHCSCRAAVVGLVVARTTGAVAGAACAGLTGCNLGEGSGVAGTTSVSLDVSGLTASRWHSWVWSWACLYCPPSITCTR